MKNRKQNKNIVKMTLYWERLYLIFIIILQSCNCTFVLPNYRVPKKYSLPSAPVYLPADLPEDDFEYLVEERPDLETILRRQRKLLLRKKEMPKSMKEYQKTIQEENKEEVVQLIENDDDDITQPLSKFKDGRSTESAKLPPVLQEQLLKVKSNETAMLPFIGANRRWFIDWFKKDPWKDAYRVGACYVCNVEQDYEIPTSPVCHRMFNSDQWIYRTLARYFRTICYYNWEYRNDGIKRFKWYTWSKTYKYPHSRGLTVHRIGGFLTGCFKRYIDISDLYSTRGCRGYWPMTIGGFVRYRFVRLQLPLTDAINTTCITSPSASLTPFHRGIYLWARYHVCVCKGRYCNKATVRDISMPLLIIGLYSILCLKS